MKKITFFDGFSSSTTPTIETLSTNLLVDFADDAAFVTEYGAAVVGNIYFNTTLDRIRAYDGSNWMSIAQTTNDEVFESTTESTDKDTGAVVIEGGLGVEKNVNIGGDAVITGDLTVNGTTTSINTATLEVEDANIIVNNGGNQATADAADAGITVEMSDATDAVIGYDSSLASFFKAGLLGSESEIITALASQTLSNKTLTSPIVNSPSIVTPSTMDVKQDTEANLITYAATASNGQLCFATDTKTMYQVVDSALTELGAGGEGGSVGDADTISLVRAANIEIADIDLSGNNADFDGGGTIDGTVSLSTTSADLILDTQVIKYVAGASSQNDYFGYTVSMPQGLRGRTIGFQKEYKNDSTTVDNDFRFCVKIKDGAQAGNISYFDMEAYSPANDEAQRATFQTWIPSDCTQIEIGWQNTDTTSGIELMVDNILVSSNPFVYKNLLQTGYGRWDTLTNYGSTNTKIPYLANERVNTITDATVDYNNTTDGFSFTANKKMLVVASIQHNNNVGGAQNGFSLNSANLTTDVASLALTELLDYHNDAVSGTTDSITVSIEMNPTDALRWHTNGGSTGFTSAFIINITTYSETEAVVHSNTGTENKFSARITSADAITSQSSPDAPAIASVASGSTGLYVVTYTTDFFGVIPAASATAEANGLNCSITAESTSGCTVNIEDASGTLTDSDFSINLENQAADYKNPNAYAVVNVEKDVLKLVDGVTAPDTIVGTAQMYVDVADGDLKIKFGDGTVKTITADT